MSGVLDRSLASGSILLAAPLLHKYQEKVGVCIRHGTQTFTYLHSLKFLRSLLHKTRERQLHTTIRLFSDVCAPRLTTTVSSTSSSCHCLFVRSYKNEGDILITTVVRDSARQSRMLVDIRVAAKQAERLMHDASRRHCRYHGVRRI